MSAILPVEALKKTFTHLQSLPMDPDTQITVELTLWLHTCRCLSIMTLMVNCTPLHSLRTFLPLELNYDVHDKELLAIWSSNDATLLEGSGLPIDVVTITGICNTFQWPKSSHINKHVGPNTFLFHLVILSVPENSDKPNALTRWGHLS